MGDEERLRTERDEESRIASAWHQAALRAFGLKRMPPGFDLEVAVRNLRQVLTSQRRRFRSGVVDALGHRPFTDRERDQALADLRQANIRLDSATWDIPRAEVRAVIAAAEAFVEEQRTLVAVDRMREARRLDQADPIARPDPRDHVDLLRPTGPEDRRRLELAGLKVALSTDSLDAAEAFLARLGGEEDGPQ